MWAVFKEFASRTAHFLSGGVTLVEEGFFGEPGGARTRRAPQGRAAPYPLLWQLRSLASDHLPALLTFLPYVQDVDVRDVRRGMYKVRFAGD